MIPQLQEALEPKEYATLPDPIKALYTLKEWMWLSSDQKARLVQTETDPETYID